MSILSILVLLVVVGVLLLAVNSFIPMAAPIKKLLNVVVVVGLVLWLCWAFGLFGYLGHFNLAPHRYFRR